MSDSIKNILSPNDVKNIVRKTFKDDCVEIIDYDLLPYSKEQIGFLGAPNNLVITVKRSPTTKPEKCNYFAKIVPTSSELLESFVKQRQVFDQEAHFYNELLIYLLDSYQDESWAPQCYLANENIIVLEDVRIKGFTMIDSKKFNIEHLKSAARELACMHACSVLAENKLKKSFIEISPNAFPEQIFDYDSKNRGLFDMLIDLIETIGRNYNRSCKSVSAALETIFQKIHNTSDIEKKVILHTDTRPNNFMFSNDYPPKCKIIDFQLIRYGKRAWDLAQLMYLSLNKETRMKEEKEMIKVYHEEFNKVIKKHNPSIKLPSFSDTLEEYEDARLIALFSAMFYYPFLLVTNEEYERHEPEDRYKKYILRENNESVIDLMKRDNEYGSRITETALELIDYCEKL